MKIKYLRIVFALLALVVALNNSYPQVTVDWYRIDKGPWNIGFESEQTAVDDSGYVYMTGTAVSGYKSLLTANLDIVTVKYSPSGNLIWQRTYFSSGTGREDFAKSLTLDKYSNVYVTGNISDTTNNTIAFVTIKYNSSGDLLWAAKQNYADYYYPYRKGLLLDSSLNVYVFCRDNNFSYMIKYNSSGDSLWKYKTDDYIYGSYLDNDYNIVTGSEHKFRKLSNTGALIWEKNFTDTLFDKSITGDNSGNYYACGWKNDSLSLLKLSNSGGLIWIKKFPRFDLFGYNFYNPQRCVISKDGNILLASQTPRGFSGDLFVKKIDPAGNLLWEVKYAVSDSSWQMLNELKEDSRGFIYAYGYSERRNYPHNSRDYFVILKIDPYGKLIRVTRYGTLPTVEGGPKSFAIDNNYKLYVGLSDQTENAGFYYGTILAKLSQPYDTLFVPVPTGYEISQNYPNPFNLTTNFSFVLPEYTHVKLSIYDALGRRIAVLVDGYMQANRYAYTWEAAGLASGLYFYRFETPKYSSTGKMILVK
ncbi:MAG: T9SS type A sorting domain-containing protein [Bacteroidetes bacterium]|nr:T9SS type A sorting domain-containing protein [Bacteroidota bacterium]